MSLIKLMQQNASTQKRVPRIHRQMSIVMNKKIDVTTFKIDGSGVEHTNRIGMLVCVC